MEHRKLTVGTLWVDGTALTLKYATVMVVHKPGLAEPDWECIAFTLDQPILGHGAHALEATTLDGPDLVGPLVGGSAVLVRSVPDPTGGASHVWRGAGPLSGLDDPAR